MKRLFQVLTSSQVDVVKGVLTFYKVRLTDHAYGQIVLELTEQNDWILEHLRSVRGQAIDAVAMSKKSAFFKKYKLQIEDYLSAQG